MPVHEGQEFIPTGEVEIAGQGSEVVEEGPTSAQCLSDGLIDQTREMEHRVKEKSQEQQREQNSGEVLFPMAVAGAISSRAGCGCC